MKWILLLLVLLMIGTVASIDYTELPLEQKKLLLADLKKVEGLDVKQEVYKSYTGEYFDVRTTKLTEEEMYALRDQLDLSVTEQAELVRLLSNDYKPPTVTYIGANDIYKMNIRQGLEKNVKKDKVVLNHEFVAIEYDVSNFDNLHTSSRIIENLNEQSKERMSSFKEVKIIKKGDIFDKPEIKAKEKAYLFGFVPIYKNNNYEVIDGELTRKSTFWSWMWRHKK